LIGYAFGELRIRRRVNAVYGRNPASIHFMERLAFRLEGNLHPQASNDVIGIRDNDGT
jgi:RimJ/RimL family protein N-acetyltransferase